MICYTTYTTVVTGQATELAKMEPKILQNRIYFLYKSNFMNFIICAILVSTSILFIACILVFEKKRVTWGSTNDSTNAEFHLLHVHIPKSM